MFRVAFFIALLMLCGQLTLSKASCCNIADRLDARQSFLVPIPGKACLRVQVYAGGKIQVDQDDPTCTEGNFLSESVADFEDYTGNVATYAEGQLGFKSTVIILEDASLTEVLYDLNFGGEFIEIVIKVPSCSVPITPTSVPTSSPIAQRDILIDLFESTNGNNWASNDDWLSSVNECEWYGVTCNEDGNLVSLSLGLNALAGTIPDSLGALSNVEELYLQSNALTSTIPDSLGALSNMNYLWLNDNDLTGTIPDSLGDLSNVNYLYLNGNALTGTIPASLGAISNVVYLSLYDNDLTGTIPDSLGDLSNVSTFDLGVNALTGTIPDSLGALSNVYYLYLDANDLTGTIPDSLGALSTMYLLYLYGNALTGTIPDSFGDLSNVGVLHLYDNELTGTIPLEVCELNITQFLYYDNEIEGGCE